MKDLIEAMKTTDQIRGRQTIYQHGLSVYRHTLFLKGVLTDGKNPLGLKLPEWMIKERAFILDNLVDQKTLKHYCLWHDLGKPFCKPDS